MTFPYGGSANLRRLHGPRRSADAVPAIRLDNSASGTLVHTANLLVTELYDLQIIRI
jgi:hypothetical protein